jgi:acyl phosphate:glycerol-3-phosphate acyltransferase
MYYWLCPLIALVAGSIPFGLLIARGCGVDIRAHGSGNIGATNVLRVCGKKPGITCLLLDLLKGFLPVVLAVNLLPIEGRAIQVPVGFLAGWAHVVPDSGAFGAQMVHILSALAAVIGHNHSPWVGFKGGKGVATSAGVLLALMPVGVLLLLVVWMAAFFITRYVSVASVLSAVSLPLMTLYGSWTHGRIEDGTWNKPLFALSLLIAVMVTWKHRSNIQRLRAGTENRFQWRKKQNHG